MAELLLFPLKHKNWCIYVGLMHTYVYRWFSTWRRVWRTDHKELEYNVQYNVIPSKYLWYTGNMCSSKLFCDCRVMRQWCLSSPGAAQWCSGGFDLSRLAHLQERYIDGDITTKTPQFNKNLPVLLNLLHFQMYAVFCTLNTSHRLKEPVKNIHPN